jgi:hypothetical protein
VDQKQQQQVNEAAEKFADALKESYQSIADRSVSAQELNAQLTQDFFNGVINNLRTQAEGNRALSEDLIEQQRKQREASRALAKESVNAYTDFLNSMFAYYKGNLDEAQRPQEIAQQGREIYERDIRKRVEEKHSGEFVVIDISTGDYEIAEDDLTASDRALAKNPDAVLYGLRIGEPAAYRLRVNPSSKPEPAVWR